MVKTYYVFTIFAGPGWPQSDQKLMPKQSEVETPQECRKNLKNVPNMAPSWGQVGCQNRAGAGVQGAKAAAGNGSRKNGHREPCPEARPLMGVAGGPKCPAFRPPEPGFRLYIDISGSLGGQGFFFPGLRGVPQPPPGAAYVPIRHLLPPRFDKKKFQSARLFSLDSYFSVCFRVIWRSHC